MNVQPSIDLSNCDKEKIHEIPFIQGHGALIVLNSIDLRIQTVSENLSHFFEIADNVQSIIGNRLGDVIGAELAIEIIERIKSHELGPLKRSKFNFYNDNLLDIYLFSLGDDLYGIEFEKLSNQEESHIPPEEVLNKFVKLMHECRNLEELSKETCRAVRAITGLDRVMMYKFFAPTMYGQVIGEDKIAETSSFMDHRFPATDIPKPARDLYLRNHVRFIYDSEKETYNLYPEAKKKVLNMSDSRLRGVSKIHIEYLKNMNVRSSFSVAVIIDNQLWGLIACHSRTPKNISHATRAQCETISNAFSMGATMFEKMSTQNGELQFFNSLHHIYEKLQNSDSPLDQLFREGQDVLNLFKSTGMVLVSKEKVDLFGLTPLPEDIKKLWNWLIVKMEDEGKSFLISNSLASLRQEFKDLKDQVSGFMAIRLAEMSDSVLIIMRPEFLETILWGGDPRKGLEAKAFNGMINPRVSFETWTEVVKNASRPWEDFEIEGLNFFKNIVFKGLIEKEDLLTELKNKLK